MKHVRQHIPVPLGNFMGRSRSFRKRLYQTTPNCSVESSAANSDGHRERPEIIIVRIAVMKQPTNHTDFFFAKRLQPLTHFTLLEFISRMFA